MKKPKQPTQVIEKHKKERIQKAIDYQKKSSDEKLQYVLETIEEMTQNNEKVNFYTVAEKAGVSRSFLYNRPSVAKLIRGAKSSQKYRSTADMSSEVRTLVTKVNKLRSEVNALRKKYYSLEDL